MMTTNYDLIKNMSIEEMAEFLCKLTAKKSIGCRVCTYKSGSIECGTNDCPTPEQWLQQEVTNE